MFGHLIKKMKIRTIFFLFMIFVVFSAGAAEPEELQHDEHTLFLSHFNGSLESSDGAEPLISEGLEFEGGIIGEGVEIDRVDKLQYDAGESGERINTEQGTIEFWYKPYWNGFDHWKISTSRIFTYGNHQNRMWIQVAGTSVQLGFYKYADDVVQSTAATAGISSWVKENWYFVAVTWDIDKELKIYIDGELSSVRDLPRVHLDPYDTFEIGYWDLGWSERALGVIDEFRISDIVREDDEIAQDYVSSAGFDLIGLSLSPGFAAVEIDHEVPMTVHGIFDEAERGRSVSLPFTGYVEWIIDMDPPGCGEFDTENSSVTALELGVINVTAEKDGLLSYENVIEVQEPDPQFVPENLTAESYKIAVDLSWDAVGYSQSAYRDSGSAGYVLYRRNASQGDPFPDDPTEIIEDYNTDQFRDIPPEGGQTYEYKLGTCDEYGNIRSLFSDPVSIYVECFTDLDVTYIERNPKYPRNLGGDRKTWPDVGETVTFTAHVINKGNCLSDPAPYSWRIDDVAMGSGTVPALSADEEFTTELTWDWVDESLPVRFSVDAGGMNEVTGGNDSLLNRTKDNQAALWVEESVFEFFEEREGAVGSFSWEDWINYEYIAFIHQTFEEAVYPLTPDGIRERVRIDTHEVIQDGIIYNAAYPPFKQSENILFDNLWGWPIAVLDGNPLDHGFIGWATHEWGHQWGLVDLYALNVVGDDIFVEDFTGELVAGTEDLPLLSFGVAYLTDRLPYMMGGDYTRWSDFSSYLLDSKTQLRRPDLVGEHLDDFSLENKIRILSAEGEALEEALVWIYHTEQVFWDWYRKVIDNVPDVVDWTDQSGLISLGDEPFGDYADLQFAEGIILIRTRYNQQVDYQFKDQIDFNMSYWAGNLEETVIDIQTDILSSAVPSEENYALFKDASASSFMPRCGPQLAVNGDKTVYSYHWSPVTTEAGEWWQVDLGEQYDVCSVIVYPQAENRKYWWNVYRIDISPTGDFTGEETTAAVEEDWPDLGSEKYNFAPVTGRYVRITAEEDQIPGYQVGLQEVEVFVAVEYTGDSDGDGLPDAWEMQYFVDLSLGCEDDPDNDGLVNCDELSLGSDPVLFDSDFDGWSDSWEAGMGFDPTQNDKYADSDLDGFVNYEEYLADTDAFDPESYPILFHNFRFSGETIGDGAGMSSIIIPDVNNDSFPDVLIAAPLNSSAVTESGKVYIIYGRDLSEFSNMTLGFADAAFFGLTAYSHLGASMAGLGDVNHDGSSDFILGEPDTPEAEGGKAYLFFGNSEGWWGDLSAAASADVAFSGEYAGARIGSALSYAGDLNGDGCNDLVISAPEADNVGKVYITFGSAESWPTEINMSDADVIISGTSPGALFGFSLAGVNDFNGDGYDDLLVGIPAMDQSPPAAGSACLFYGKAVWAQTMSSGDADTLLIGEMEDDAAGYSVAGIGDCDADGFADLAVAAPDYGAGKAYIFYGRTEMLPALVSLADADIIIAGENPGDKAGASLCSAGDTDGDGLDDLLIGAPGYTENQNTGAVYLLQDGPQNWPASLSDAELVWTGENYFNYAGSSCSGGYDIDGDGYHEFISGSPSNRIGGSERGKSYLRFPDCMPWPDSVNQIELFEDSAYSVPLTGAVQPGNAVYVQVNGDDPYMRPNIVLVQVTSDTDPDGIIVSLTETGDNSNVFRGHVKIDYAASDALNHRISVSPGDYATFCCILDDDVFTQISISSKLILK